jgi:hypothetical protein
MSLKLLKNSKSIILKKLIFIIILPMKDSYLNYEKNDDICDDLLNKFSKADIDFDCNGISFSDTCSSVKLITHLIFLKIYLVYFNRCYK